MPAEPTPTALHRLGEYIVNFQHLEATLNEVLDLLSGVQDSRVMQILCADLSFAAKVKAAVELFALQEHLSGAPGSQLEKDFRALGQRLIDKIAQRRNRFVHSRWFNWTNVEGRAGLLLKDERLSSKQAFLDREEEELLSEDFEKELGLLSVAIRDLEKYRLLLIERRYV